MAGQAGETGASSRWPSEMLEDWAGFADQLSVVAVVDESDLPLRLDGISERTTAT